MLRAPLAVRVDDGVSNVTTSRQASGLRFRKTAPGGFHSAQVRLNLPRETFRDLGGADRVYVYGPDGSTLWEGFADNPGRSDGVEGEGFDLSAMGSSIVASDESRTLVYRDHDLGSWGQNKTRAASASAAATDDPDPPAMTTPENGLLCQFNPGQPVGTNAAAQIGYTGLQDSGMELGGIQLRLKSGKTDSDYRNELLWSSAPGVSGSDSLDAIDATQSATIVRYAGGAVLPTGQDAVALQLVRTGGATNVADDDTWTFFDDVAIVGRRKDRYGVDADAVAMQPMAYVLGHLVVEDILGRLLILCDPDTAVIEEGDYEIDQLAYLEGTTAAQLLDDLIEWESDFIWEIGASQPGGGFQFSWRRWPERVRYEISTRDAYDAPGSDVDLCNRIAVFWTNRRGVKKSLTITASSADYPALAALEDAGRVKDAEPITLPDGLGSLANATRIGTQSLAARANPPVSATAVVRRRILDLYTGNWIYPWQIEPGHLVRVRETGDVLPLTEIEYVDDDEATTLQLGTPLLTDDQRIARLAKKRRSLT